MLTKKIFLASSSELESDRKDFEVFISRKNKNWVNQGVFLELIVWEDFLDAVSNTRLQDEYNKAIRECDIFVMLFCTKVGKYTEEEFETAFGQFKATNKPLIFTYFKDVQISTGSADKQDLTSLWSFQKKLRALGHFQTVYTNIDGLKLHFDQQLDKLHIPPPVLRPPTEPDTRKPSRQVLSDIFISYKREEQDIARRLANALEQQGWTVWWDPKLRAGERFDDVIEAALQGAKCIIVMWSRRSVQSEYVKDEALYALKRKKLAPVAIEDVELPFRFEVIHTPQLIGWDGTETAPEFCRLVEDISSIIGPPATKSVEQTFSFERDQVQKPQSWENTLEPWTTVFRDTLRDRSREPEMVMIPMGEFKMGDLWGDGDEFEKPVHTVHIRRPFALGRYPVTFEEYDMFSAAAGRELPDDTGWGRGTRPVINISWEDAIAYAAWLSKHTGKCYRLPSEAEWEYAARSCGIKEKWAGTSAEGELGGYAWYDENSGKKTHPVGEKKPNGLGLYDMSGNVWEWVGDWWHNTYEDAPDDGSVWESGDSQSRVIRGGAWYIPPGGVRSANRHWSNPVNQSHSIGFRLSQDV